MSSSPLVVYGWLFSLPWLGFQPSIHGTTTFPQFFSVRQAARQCGHISITEHFKEWASSGMTLGKMYEAKILVEAGGGSGSIDFTSATVTAK